MLHREEVQRKKEIVCALIQVRVYVLNPEFVYKYPNQRTKVLLLDEKAFAEGKNSLSNRTKVLFWPILLPI